VIVFNPPNKELVSKRLVLAESILNKLPVKHCFISGSFLFKQDYKDIDVFVVSRTKKKITLKNPKVKISFIDFNNLHSLFYHSLQGSYISKSFLISKSLKVTFSDYWKVINESIPNLLNNKKDFKKSIRSLVLYTNYFSKGIILDSFQLTKGMNSFKDYKSVLKYLDVQVPIIANKKIKKSYLKRFFYTQSGFYRNPSGFEAQRYLKHLSELILSYRNI